MTPIFVSCQFSNILWADHQQYCPGQIQIQRGADHLLINAPVWAQNQYGMRKSPWGNIVNISCLRKIGVGDGRNPFFVLPTDLSFIPAKWRFWTFDKGLWSDKPLTVSEIGSSVTFTTPPPAGAEVFADFSEGRQAYPESMSANYGTPGVTILGQEFNDEYCYLAGDYKCAYQPQVGVQGPCLELTRQFVYLRPNIVVVYDRIETVKPDFLKRVQWHCLPTSMTFPNGNKFAVQTRDSVLEAETFSTDPLTTTLETVECSGKNGVKTVQQLRTQPAAPVAKTRMLTVLQAGGQEPFALPVGHFVDGDDEFANIGDWSVNFTREGPVTVDIA